jgi:hypothetical protein
MYQCFCIPLDITFGIGLLQPIFVDHFGQFAYILSVSFTSSVSYEMNISGHLMRRRPIGSLLLAYPLSAKEEAHSKDT